MDQHNASMTPLLPHNMTSSPPVYGLGQIFEIFYLVLLSVFGTFGNLLVIFSIIHAGVLHNVGNIFIVNLAISDVMITALFMPTAIPNVMTSSNNLTKLQCHLIAYIGDVSMTCSIYNLTCVALNRYWAVCRSTDYERVFEKNLNIFRCFLVWFVALASLTPSFWLLEHPYDEGRMLCLWNNDAPWIYTVLLVVLNIVFPFLVQCGSYWAVSRVIKNKRKWLMLHKSMNQARALKKRRTELIIFRTLIFTIAAYLVLWMPFGVIIVMEHFAMHIPTIAKKISGWMAITNSSVNFIIFGVLNKTYQTYYKNFLLYCLRKGSCRDSSTRTRQDQIKRITQTRQGISRSQETSGL